MCVYSDILIQGFKRIMKQTCFSYFDVNLRSKLVFKIKTSIYAWTCDEQLKTCKEHIRTFKNIQTYSREFK